MKAKTKRRVIHVLTKKKLVKKKTSQSVLRTFLIALATVSISSLAYAIALNKPTVSVAVNSSAPGGFDIKAAPSAPAAGPVGGPPAMSGRASWYALGLPQPDALTCASRTFPRGTYVHVTDLYNQHTMVCRVNDYGPEAWTGRILDLSRGSFRAVDSLGRGTIPVDLRIVSSPTGFLSPVDDYIFNAVIGYNSCHLAHDPKFCDAHRQD